MRTITFLSKSNSLSHKDLWNVMATLEKYPEWCKYCKSIISTDVKEGAAFQDITTLLLIPLKTTHIITKVEQFEELHFFLPLPGGGKMWHRFKFRQQNKDAYLTGTITFDLGNRIINATIGHILEQRWKKLLLQGFPGLDEKRIVK